MAALVYSGIRLISFSLRTRPKYSRLIQTELIHCKVSTLTTLGECKVIQSFTLILSYLI